MITLKKASVSVVIPCFNCSETVERALESVNKQTLKPLEVLIVNDCSSDNSLVFIESLKSKYQDGWIKIVGLHENVGPADARNSAWAIAKGDYIAFLDADDSWHPKKIELQYSWMLEHQDVMLTGHDCDTVNSHDEEQIQIKILEPVLVSKLRILTSNRFPTRTVMLKNSIQERFEPGQRYSEDYLLWLKIILNNHKAYRFSNVLAFRYKEEFGAGGLSQNLWVMEKHDLQNGYHLYNEKLINVWILFGFSIYSLLKFVRKFLIVMFR